jgi:NAD(P)-dependent dehydrogenase (short-subunit alcohol dehydrogenase family)
MVANAGVFCHSTFTQSAYDTIPARAWLELNFVRAASVEKFDWLMGINVRGTMLCYKRAAVQMIAQGRGGRIINLIPLLLLPL